MPDELKPCPFCWSNAGYCGDAEYEEYVWCVNPYCRMHNRYEFTVSFWNSRPIENALRAENSRLLENIRTYREEVERLRASFDLADTRGQFMQAVGEL